MRCIFCIMILIIILSIYSCNTVKYTYKLMDKNIVKMNNDTTSDYIKTKETKIIYKNNNDLYSDIVFKIKMSYKKKIFGEITSKYFPAITIIGNIEKQSDGSIEKLIFNVERLKYFSNWENGWMEAEQEAISGRFIFEKRGTENIYFYDEIIETGDLINGDIRYYDEKISNEKAVREIKNRLDRIIAVDTFLKKQNMPKFIESLTKKTVYSESYKKLTQKILFPELVSNSILYMDLSGDYKIKSKDDYTYKESVRWNKKYTKKIFPEELREVRDSGNMLKDYEESLTIFYSIYNLNYILEKVMKESNFK